VDPTYSDDREGERGVSLQARHSHQLQRISSQYSRQGGGSPGRLRGSRRGSNGTNTYMKCVNKYKAKEKCERTLLQLLSD